jgi:hypothetical protein
MTAIDALHRWPLRCQYITPTGDVVQICSHADGKSWAEHAGRCDSFPVKHDDIETWLQITCEDT